MFETTIKIGDRQTLNFKNADIKAIHRFGAVYGALPRECDACDSGDIYLSHKAPKNNDFYLLVCRKCGAELTIHLRKDGHFYVKRDEKMSVYSGTAMPKDESKNESKESKKDETPF